MSAPMNHIACRRICGGEVGFYRTQFCLKLLTMESLVAYNDSDSDQEESFVVSPNISSADHQQHCKHHQRASGQVLGQGPDSCQTDDRCKQTIPPNSCKSCESNEPMSHANQLKEGIMPGETCDQDVVLKIVSDKHTLPHVRLKTPEVVESHTPDASYVHQGGREIDPEGIGVAKDYFRLNDESGSESDDNIEDTAVADIDIQCLKSRTKSEGVRNVKFRTGHCSSACDVGACSRTGAAEFASPQSDYWTKKNPNPDWTDTKSLWGKDKMHGETCGPVSGLNSTIPAKRKKMDGAAEADISSPSSSLVSSQAGNQRQKSFYFVHHRVSPFLHAATKTCRISKKQLTALPGHSGAVNRVAWCGAQFSHLLLSASMDRTIRVWNPMTSTPQTCVQTLAFHDKAVKDAVWSPCNRQILSCGYDRTARLLDVEKGVELSCLGHSDYVTCVQYHPVHGSVFVAGTNNALYAWDLRCTKKHLRKYTYKDTIGQVQDLAFLREGKEFISCNTVISQDSADRNIIAWDFGSGVSLSNQIYQERYTCARLKQHPHEATFLAQSQGDYLAAFSSIRPYRMNKCRRYEGHKVSGYSVGFDFSPDGQYVVSGSADGRLVFYSYRYARTAGSVSCGRNEVCLDVVWHPVLPSVVATGAWSGAVVVWQ